LSKPSIEGAVKVKPDLVAGPPGVTTFTSPVAPVPTTAVILVALTTVKEVAAVPPKLTEVAPVKLVPVMVTVSPDLAEVGVNDVMVGAVGTGGVLLLLLLLQAKLAMIITMNPLIIISNRFLTCFILFFLIFNY
jgi:hypothetical protein